MTPLYQIADAKDNSALNEYLAQNGQLLLPMVELISSAHLAVEEFMDVLGWAALEAVLALSARQAAGPRHQGTAVATSAAAASRAAWSACPLKKVRVRMPRLRRKGGESRRSADPGLRSHAGRHEPAGQAQRHSHERGEHAQV